MELFQENGRGKSDAPMIMGIIGFVATIPGTLCAGCMGACASAAETLSTGQSSGMASVWILTNLASAGAGLFFGIKSKGTPRTSGAVMIGVAVLTLLLSFITLNWFWGLIAVACFGIGGAISLTQEKVGGTDQPQNLRATDAQTTFAPPVFEPKIEEQEKTVAPPPPVVEVSPVNPPVQKFASPVTQEHRATYHTERSEYTYSNRQNVKSSNLWIWGLVAGALILVAAVVVMELMPSKNSSPEKVVALNKPQSKPPLVNQSQPTSQSTPNSSIPVTESAVSIGYVKTKMGSTLRMRKEPSETADILVNIPDASPVIILGYDDRTSIVNGETGKWCKIKFNDQTGWAWGNFIIRK